MRTEKTLLPLKGKTAVVAGMGRSGIAAARLLKREGADVRATDARTAEALIKPLQTLTDLGCETAPGGHPEHLLDGADLLVLSPGVPHTIPFCCRAGEKGVPVIGEMDLAWRFLSAPAIGVTGSNGKTTTVELIAEMLRAAGKSVFAGGNIGTPLSEFILSGQKADWAVVEISSFQLDTAHIVHPRIAVLLNITEDHLDRYPGFDAYAASKARIFRRQTPADLAVINGRDPRCRAAVQGIASRVAAFDRDPETESCGADLAGNRLILRPVVLYPEPSCPADMHPAEAEPVELDLSRSPLAGRHNRENIAAAALAALAAGGTPEGVRSAIDGYTCAPHRIQPAGEVDGVRYFNDSKGTNPDAVSRAVAAMDRPVVLIMGGRGKGNAFDGLAPVLSGRVHTLVAMGETGPEIAAVLGPAVETVVRATDMADAVAKARSHARAGDAVLLSPGCASFDLYASYAARGEDFIRLSVKKGTP
ncbi:MAG: UDP-N-acetylmuramoyl-L-alanine--D-glutamate ligase [Desulfococcus sp.]|nr:MAG: UDP-N-acetylmuramoyl-L-alanine--D-glutamate ligase [Desulfococcus sp.]